MLRCEALTQFQSSTRKKRFASVPSKCHAVCEVKVSILYEEKAFCKYFYA